MINDDARRRLGAAIRTARTQARLSIESAAKQAGVSPTTLGRIERGEPFDVRGQTYSAIEQVIGWAPGSVARILAGGDPIPQPGRNGTTDTEVDHIATWEADLIEAIWANQLLSDDVKEDLTARARTKVAELRAIQDRLRRSAG